MMEMNETKPLRTDIGIQRRNSHNGHQAASAAKMGIRSANGRIGRIPMKVEARDKLDLEDFPNWHRATFKKRMVS